MGDVARLPQLHGRRDRQEGASTKISDYLDDAKQNATIVAGRHGDDGEEGYFIEPTLVETTDPGYRLLCEEIFGPVVTAYVYRRREVGGDARDGRSRRRRTR